MKNRYLQACFRRSQTLPITVLLLALILVPLSQARAPNNPYLCKCTCFVTNTTVVPLYSPIDPQNPCTTCTRQFCLNQGLEACKGAKIERPDADTGTGWEGEVWAKCLRPDSERDKSIISLYILTVLILLVYAKSRIHIHTWLNTNRVRNPEDIYNAVMTSPWVRSVGDRWR